MKFGLHGKSVLVTGAGGAIGQAIAQAFAAEGARLALVDQTADALKLTADSVGSMDATQHLADLGDPSAARAAVLEAADRHGGLDVLVNCAGVLQRVGLAEMTVPDWDHTLDVNLRAAFVCTQAAADVMVPAGGGRVINIASQLGLSGGAGLSHYVASKAGVIGLTKALARELVPHGILVNAVAPGPVESAMVRGPDHSNDWRRRTEGRLPLGRFGTPHEVAPSVVFLAGRPSGNLYVGQVLGPNSGDVMP